MRERGFVVQQGLPWRKWKCNTPTIIHCLDGRGSPAFGMLGHFARFPIVVKRVGIFMDSKPAPVGVYVFVPENAPFHIDIEFNGTYPIEVVKSPPYAYNPSYDGDSKDNEDQEWRSSFSISLRARKPPE